VIRRGERVLRAVAAALIATLSLGPLARIAAEAIGGDASWATLLTPASRTALAHSVVVGLGGMAAAGVLGGGFGLLLGITDIRGKGLLGALFVLLMILPAQATTLAWITLAGPSSPVLAPLGLAPAMGQANPLYGPAGIALLLGIETAPLVFIILRGASRTIPHELIRAAQSSGASPALCLRRVVLPLLAPAWRAGLGLAFVSGVGNFGTPALLGIPGRYPTLPTLIYQRLVSFGPSSLGSAALLSMGLLALAAAGVGAELLLGRGTAVRLQGVADAAPLLRLGGWRLPAELLAWGIVLVLLAVPLASLLGTALVGAYGQALDLHTATAANFRFVFADAAFRRALANSGLLAAGAAVLLGGLAVAAGYLAVWRDARGIAVLLRAADLAYALPGTVLALACILLFIRPLPLGFGLRLPLYDTLGIILIAYLARFLTLAQRPVAAAFRLLDPRLEQAAQASGADLAQRLRRVMLPLVAPAATAGALLVFLTAFNELTVSALLWSAGHETVGVVMFSLEQAGEITLAAAVAVVSAAVVMLLMAACSLLGGRLPPGLLPWK
jgi:iron(III) transport system permease protein